MVGGWRLHRATWRASATNWPCYCVYMYMSVMNLLLVGMKHVVIHYTHTQNKFIPLYVLLKSIVNKSLEISILFVWT